MTIIKKTKQVRSEEDSAWKEVMDAYFKDFVEYCLPKLYALIDYQNQRSKLEASTNPFASVILMQLAAIQAKGRPDEERKQK